MYDSCETAPEEKKNDSDPLWPFLWKHRSTEYQERSTSQDPGVDTHHYICRCASNQTVHEQPSGSAEHAVEDIRIRKFLLLLLVYNSLHKQLKKIYNEKINRTVELLWMQTGSKRALRMRNTKINGALLKKLFFSFRLNHSFKVISSNKILKLENYLRLTFAACTLLSCPRSFNHICPVLAWEKSSSPMSKITQKILSTVLCSMVSEFRSIPEHANSSTTSTAPPPPAPPPSLLRALILSYELGVVELDILEERVDI